MKRIIILFMLVFQLNHLLFASDDIATVDANVGIGFLFPLDKNENVGLNLLVSLLLSTFTVGAGFHLNVIENIFSPGIYGDIHMSLLSLLSNNDTDVKTETNKEENSFLFFQTGARFYNHFRFGLLEIQPFIGINIVLTTNIEPIALKAYGVLMTYDGLGIEYSYQIPLNLINDTNIFKEPVHRIVIIIHLSEIF